MDSYIIQYKGLVILFLLVFVFAAIPIENTYAYYGGLSGGYSSLYGGGYYGGSYGGLYGGGLYGGLSGGLYGGGLYDGLYGGGLYGGLLGGGLYGGGLYGGGLYGGLTGGLYGGLYGGLLGGGLYGGLYGGGLYGGLLGGGLYGGGLYGCLTGGLYGGGLYGGLFGGLSGLYGLGMSGLGLLSGLSGLGFGLAEQVGTWEGLWTTGIASGPLTINIIEDPVIAGVLTGFVQLVGNAVLPTLVDVTGQIINNQIILTGSGTGLGSQPITIDLVGTLLSPTDMDGNYTLTQSSFSVKETGAFKATLTNPVL